MIEDTNERFAVDGGILYNKDYTEMIGVLPGVSSITIRSTITSIPYKMFSECNSLVSITIPDGVTYIGEYAFSGCINLKEITISDNVTYIGNSAFMNCISLTSITLPSSMKTIPNELFLYCHNLSKVNIPEGVESIGSHVFYGCTNLLSITIPHSVKSIDENAFAGSPNDWAEFILKITNKSSVTLTFDDVPETVKVIEDAKGNKTYRTYQDGQAYVETEDQFLFRLSGPYNNNIVFLKAYLGNEEMVTLPQDYNGTQYVINHFRGSMDTVILPYGINAGYSQAFYGCKNLANIVLPDSVYDIGWQALIDTEFYNNSDNWKDGCLYAGKHLMKVAADVEKLVIRSDTVGIAPDAFEGCYLLKEVTISGNHAGALEDLTNIETLILTDCSEIDVYRYFHEWKIDIPFTLSKIIIKDDCEISGKYAFQYITDVTIFVEASKEDCPWDKVYPGWSNGNVVVYGDDWNSVSYYDENGSLITTHQYRTSEVIKPPFMYSYVDKDSAYQFMGWDMDGDGIADALPATLYGDCELYAVFQTTTAKYLVEYLDMDGKTVLYS